MYPCTLVPSKPYAWQHAAVSSAPPARFLRRPRGVLGHDSIRSHGGPSTPQFLLERICRVIGLQRVSLRGSRLLRLAIPTLSHHAARASPQVCLGGLGACSLVGGAPRARAPGHALRRPRGRAGRSRGVPSRERRSPAPTPDRLL